jgi:hypothetical protein
LNPEDLIAEVQARLFRNLTRSEWESYLGGMPYRKTCPNLPEAPVESGRYPVPPAASDDAQPAPSPAEVDQIAAEQLAPSPAQAAPPAPTGPAAPAASAALTTRDLTLPPAAASPSPSPAETPVETTPVPEGGPGATPPAAVLPVLPASTPPDNAAALGDGRAATLDTVPEGGSERLEGAPGTVRAQQDDPPSAFSPNAPRPKARGRHDHRPRPPARPQPPPPTFLQRLFGLFGHKETQPGKPRP